MPAAVQRFHPLDGDYPVLSTAIRAPQALRYPHKSSISGSRAALCSTVVPSAGGCRKQHVLGCPHAGQGQGNFRPLQPPLGAAAQMPPLLLDGDAQLFQGVQVQVDGRGPSSHPPGKDMRASPHLAIIAPKKTMEERISRIR